MKPKSTLHIFLAIAGSSLLTIASASAQATSGTWDENNAGNWTTITNWVGDTAYAEGADNTATFGNFINADRTVTLDAPITIGNIIASDADKNYTVSGANTLTLDRTSGIPSIDVTVANRTFIIDSLIAGNDGLAKDGAGILTLTNTGNNFTGGVTINGGQIRAINGALGTNLITFTGTSGNLRGNASTTFANDISIASGVTGTIETSNYITSVSGAVSSQGTLILMGTATGGTTLSSTSNNITGAVVMDGANGIHTNSITNLGNTSAYVTARNSAGFSGSSVKILNLTLSSPLTERRFEINDATGLTLSNNSATAANTITVSGDLLLSGEGAKTLTLGGTHTGTNAFNGLLADSTVGLGGALSVTKFGNSANEWVLGNASNSYTGVTTINQGRLFVSKLSDFGENSSIGQGTAGVAMIMGSSNVTGVLIYTGSGDTTNRTIQLNSSNGNSDVGSAWIINNGDGALTFDAPTLNAAYATTSTATRNLNIGGSNNGFITGVVQNNSGTSATGLTKTDGGSWTLSGANTYTAVTTVLGGNLIAGTNSLASTNGAFGNATSDIVLGAAGGNVDAGLLIGGAFTVGRNIRNATSNTSDAGTRLLTIGGNTAANSVFSGDIFLGTSGQTSKGIQLTAATNGQVTFSGVIQETGGSRVTGEINAATALDSVTKVGGGTVILSNANTYLGKTVVSQGKLLVNNTTGSGTGANSVTIGSGGTLGGSGIIAGNVTTQGGGTFAPGASIESLATGSLSQQAGSIFAYEANNNALPAAAGDLTAITGNLTLDLSNAAILTLSELGSGTWDINDKLTLISYSAVWNGGLFEYLGSEVADDSTIAFSGYNWSFNYNDTVAGTNFTSDLTGTSFVTMTAVSAIPEPSAALLGVFGLIALLRRRR